MPINNNCVGSFKGKSLSFKVGVVQLTLWCAGLKPRTPKTGTALGRARRVEYSRLRSSETARTVDKG